MPIYDYLCSSCGQRTEVIHGIHDPTPRFCPSCGAEGTLRKGFSTPAILFKGSGWAKKDRAATRSPKSPAPSDASDGGSGSASADADSKPAAKPDAASSTKPAATGTGGD
jgi:putative FmdB family regulatory protein